MLKRFLHPIKRFGLKLDMWRSSAANQKPSHLHQDGFVCAILLATYSKYVKMTTESSKRKISAVISNYF